MTQDALNESTASYSRWSTDGEHSAISPEDRDPEQVDIQYSNKRYELTSTQKFLYGKRGIFLMVLVLLVTFVFGAVMGYVIRKEVPGPKPQALINMEPDDNNNNNNSNNNNKSSGFEQLEQDYEIKQAKFMLGDISRVELENNLKFFAEKPRLASTIENQESVDYIVSKWTEYGFTVETKPYNVLLTCRSEYWAPNTVSIVDDLNADHKPVVIKSQTEFSELGQPFNAYSKVTTAKGLPLYANYGRKEDFETLRSQSRDADMVKGTIVIMRYGKLFRGDKVKNAMEAGAVGAVLYSDPADYSDFIDGDVLSLPLNGTQRGSVRSGYGDPLTPGMPSTDDAYRLNESNADLPSIPVISISANGAKVLMFDGNDHLEFPAIDWKNPWIGGLLKQSDGNLGPYYRGPGYIDKHHEVEITINSPLCRKDIKNVVATIQGAVEPDRYVLVGNHRDSWTYGATDPASGTSVLMELSRALSKLVKQGWKPRRTIMLISWDAEEFGMVGSHEWVEENRRILEEGAVAYLNLDAAVIGNYSFAASASPLLSQVIYEATRKVPCPNHSAMPMSVYEDWREKLATPSTGQPNVGYLGSGSDHHAFAQIIGVPSLDIFYSNHPNIRDEVLYPTYHTGFDSFANLKANVDRDFAVHEAMARILSELVLQLADDLILPIDCAHYLGAFQEGLAQLKSILGSVHIDHVLPFQDSVLLDRIEGAIEAYRKSVETFEEEINHSDLLNPLVVRSINDRKSKLERSFISNTELPNSKHDRHLVYAPSKNNQYGSSLFPALISSIETATKGEESQPWEEVKKQSAMLTLSIRAAAKTLQGDFKG